MELRDLPGVDSLAADLTTRLPYSLPVPLIMAAARRAIDEARQIIRNGGEADPAELAIAGLEPLATSRPRPVINATCWR